MDSGPVEADPMVRSEKRPIRLASVRISRARKIWIKDLLMDRLMISTTLALRPKREGLFLQGKRIMSKA